MRTDTDLKPDTRQNPQEVLVLKKVLKQDIHVLLHLLLQLLAILQE
jgi:hypothetical protein